MTREEAIGILGKISNPRDKEALATLIPELHESEDEKIRKEIIKFIEDFCNPCDGDCDKWIAWLEKQKEQKPSNMPPGFYFIDLDGKKFYSKEFRYGDMKMKVVENEKEQKPVDYEAELKKCKDNPLYFYDKYVSIKQKPAEWSEEDERMLSRCVKSIESSKQFADSDTFKKAKDNEIDWLENRFKFLCPQQKVEWSEDKFPKDIEKDATQFCFDKGINITPHQAKEIATHYLMVGHNEGYVEGRKNAHIPARELGLPSSMDFKQEWSEEDERMRSNILNVLTSTRVYTLGSHGTSVYKYNNEIEWLKSFPLNLKKKNEDVAKLCSNEWSKEDEERVKQLIYDTEAIRAGYEKRKESLGDDFNDELIKDCDEQINWLKSLRPSWKPSEEQMRLLQHLSKRIDVVSHEVDDMSDDLRKLM